MTITEEKPRGMFGEIRLADLHKHEELLNIVLPLIKRACEFSGARHTVDSVVDGLIAGRYRLWTAAKPNAELQAVAVSALTKQDGVKAFELILLGGPQIDGLLQFIPALKARAKEAGAAKLVIVGRRSWARELEGDWTAVFETSLVEPD